MLFKDNPAYKLEIELNEGAIRIYSPSNIQDGYHTSRYVEAVNQQIYANAGATKDVLKSVMDEIVLRCNKQFDKETFRTDIAALANSVLYRLKYPIDQHCAIRIGCTLSFMEYESDGKTFTEPTDKVDIIWQSKKEKLAHDYPALYTFFLTTGVNNIQQYREASDTLSDSDYFLKREQAIASLMPQQ